MYKIRYLKTAIQDLAEVYSFIEQDNPLHATNVLDSIEKSIRYLEHFPFIGTKIDDTTRYIVDPRYRYKIIYQLKKDTIYIVSLFKYRDTWGMSDDWPINTRQ